MRNNYNTALEAVKQNGLNLKYITNKLKNDEDIVIEAVKQNGLSLKFAPNVFKQNKKVVMEAVKQGGYKTEQGWPGLFKTINHKRCALRYASAKLKRDKEVVLTAINKNPKSIKYAAKELLTDYNFLIQSFLEVKKIHKLN